MTDDPRPEPTVESGGSSRNVRRAFLVVALFVALAAGVAIGVPDRRTPPAPSLGRAELAPAFQAASDAITAPSYCALASQGVERTATRDTVTIANTADARRTFEWAAVANGRVVRRTRSTLAARTSTTVDVRALPASSALIVEAFGPGIVVQHDLQARSDTAGAPCATRTAPRWFVPVASTARGISTHVSVFNPYGADAVVDVRVYTTQGIREPSALQGATVPRRGRLDLDLNAYADRNDVVAARITTRDGAGVVAEEFVARGGAGVDNGGVALDLAALPGDRTWYFTPALGGATRTLVLLNPSDLSAEIALQLVIDENSVVPATVTVAPGELKTVDIAALGGRNAVRSVTVARSTSRLVLAAMLTDGTVGYDARTGIGTTARRWQWAATAPLGAGTSARQEVLVRNTDDRPAAIEVFAERDGARRRLASFTIGPNAVRAVPVGDAATSAAITVTSSRPLVADLVVSSTSGEATVVAGAPSRA